MNWKGNYKGSIIEVQSTWFNGKVLINNIIQDVNYGWFGKSQLESFLPNSETPTNINIKLKAGLWKIKCSVFADGKQIEMEELKA